MNRIHQQSATANDQSYAQSPYQGYPHAELDSEGSWDVPSLMTNENKTIQSTIDVGEITTYKLPHMELREGSRTIDVEKSSSHHLGSS